MKPAVIGNIFSFPRLAERPLDRMNARILLLASFLALGGCAVRNLPGTEIEDTDDTRAILQVMETYRQAVEARDADRILSVVAESFKDDQGTAPLDDDLDYQGLREQLPKNLARLDDVRLELTVKNIEVDDRTKTAQAVYTYTTSFRMPGLNPKPQSDSEIKQMTFKQVAGVWKITSGI